MSQNIANVFANMPFSTHVVELLTAGEHGAEAKGKVDRYVELSQEILRKKLLGQHPTGEYTIRAELGRELKKWGVSAELLKLVAAEARATINNDKSEEEVTKNTE